MEAVKFSIITISYNHAEFIEDTLRSVIAQNYTNFEHIVIDGGSTDDTVSILKRYPHLDWISERDRGISHALNKGLKKATGDIVAWINADDWFAPNIFDEVASLYPKNHIIFGDAVETDRAGKEVRTVINHPRSIFDLQKYWVPHAWLAQPSVFFSREALESVRLPNGDFIDESFNYSMDCDLWLRFAQRYPFTCHSNKVYSYFRIYGENATGKTFASPQRELGRAFRRSMNTLMDAERELSIVLPVQSLKEPVAETVQALMEQTLQGFDIIIVDGTTEKEEQKILKETCLSLEESTTLIGIRHLKRYGQSLDSLIAEGISANRSLVFSVIRPGDIPEKNFTGLLQNVFAHDPYGATLLTAAGSALTESIFDKQTGLMMANALLSLKESFIPFAARSLAVAELGGYTSDASTQIAQRLFLLKMLNRGWLITGDNAVTFKQYAELGENASVLDSILAPYIRSSLFLAGSRDTEGDIFHPVRMPPYSIKYPHEQVASAKAFLDSGPQDWDRFSAEAPTDELKALVNRFPMFSPAWYFLWKRYTKEGVQHEAKQCEELLRRVRPDITGPLE